MILPSLNLPDRDVRKPRASGDDPGTVPADVACDYVNPARAGMIQQLVEDLEGYFQ